MYVFDSNQSSDIDKKILPGDLIQEYSPLPFEGIGGIMSARYNLKHALESTMKILLQNTEINYKKTHNLDSLLKQMQDNLTKLKISESTFILWINVINCYKYEYNHMDKQIEDYSNDINRYGSNKGSDIINTRRLFEIERKELVKIKEDIKKARDIFLIMCKEQQEIHKKLGSR